MLEYQDPSLEIAKTCSFIAWSRGLKYFAVRNSSECLGGKHLPSLLSQLKAAKGCYGGRGGQNVSDVYRFTGKKAFIDCNTRNACRLLFLSINNPILYIASMHYPLNCLFICPSIYSPPSVVVYSLLSSCIWVRFFFFNVALQKKH